MPEAKRIFDLLVSVPIFILLLPLLAAIAVMIRIGSPGPAFFRQERVGRGGQTFRILKFRTMVADAEGLGKRITVGKDPRITPLGAFLRKYKLDELPQLINVIRGEMSIVGPRPEVPGYVALYDPRQRRVLEARPGLTGPASIRFSNESELLGCHADPESYYVNVIMPQKIDEDLAYLARATVLSDLALILRTAARILAR